MSMAARKMDVFVIAVVVVGHANPVTAIVERIQVDLVFMRPSMLQVHAGSEKVDILVASRVDASCFQARLWLWPAILSTGKHLCAAFAGPAVPREHVMFALNSDLIETVNRPVFSVSIIIVNEFMMGTEIVVCNTRTFDLLAVAVGGI
jgi:hypothetical protein